MNHLQHETSPYLLQHADNPVDWHPWNEEALAKARAEDKPILLSIGYSACHWCHVMAHESFEDEATAAVMNELYVNIKVDREERPDLDKIYQTAHQLMARRAGGWPLTMFLNPHNLTPYYGGTYFPRQDRYNLPGFVPVLRQAAEFYHSEKDKLARHNQAMQNALHTLAAQGQPSPELPSIDLLHEARRNLARDYDSELGGFGQAPKFPHCAQLEFLLRYHLRDGADDTAGLQMVTHTLRKMAEGGIYDQLGGGFCRYSVDAQWLIPHFEKMLYDNGPLLGLYADAWRITGDALYARVAEATAGWALREMRAPEGGFYAALDADSEGHEGKFYVWDRDAVKALLDADEYAVLATHYGLSRPPNFEEHWHLYLAQPLEAVADRLQIPLERAQSLLASGRQKLWEVRRQRVRPGLDDKRLAAWNGLMITGLARAGRTFGRRDWVDAATAALDAVRSHCWRGGRLLATYKDGEARLNAYLDDHAFLMQAALELLQCRWRGADLEFAMQLADVLIEHYSLEEGGFYYTADDHEALLQRPRGFADEAMASGNGVAALSLLHLGHLVGEIRYTEAAESTLCAAATPMAAHPDAHVTLLTALEEAHEPPTVVLLRGEPGAIEAWRAELDTGYAPHRLCFAIPTGETALPGLLAARAPQGEAVAYVCRGVSCLPPIADRVQLKGELGI